MLPERLLSIHADVLSLKTGHALVGYAILAGDNLQNINLMINKTHKLK